MLGGIGGLTLFGCSGGSGPSTTAATGGTSTTTTGTTTSATTPTTGNCVLIPQETIGPYPLFDDIASAAAYRDVSDADRTANRATGGYDAELTVGIAI